ncbi:TatD family hydrolase [Salinisphaera orenii]|uniref:TatD family hydrolase n=1 Tax=Salinisphaera orenii TaxID=856731 RepID=UPI000DBE177D
MTLVDIGANLAHESFDADRQDVRQRAHAAGVHAMVVTGSDHASNASAVELARTENDLAATAGLHPHHAESWGDALAEQIADAAGAGDIAAVGEAGLDYFRDLSPRDAQATAFEAQLDIARRHQLPVFLHQREAHADFAAILKNTIDDLPAAVVHCFTGDRDALETYLELGCHIGITGWICDERRGQSVARLLPEIPSDRLMIETDCPFLLPRSLDSKPATRRNEPSFLPEVARAAAVARGESVSALASATTATAERFFGLKERHAAASVAK